MTPKKNEPPIVAELGRPETPEETAARKAENSRLHRQRQTVNNLVLSLLASLGLVLLLVLIVPRGTGDFNTRNVDVVSLAAEAEPSAGHTLVAPEMGDDWLAKQAVIRFSKTDRITHWYIGFTTPEKNYAEVIQAFMPDSSEVNETWVAGRLEGKLATGTETIAGQEWTVYEHLGDDPAETNVTFGLTTTVDASTLIVSGTAPPERIRALAEAAIESY